MKALTLYGTESDIAVLAQLVEKEYDRRRVLVVDFTPFLTLGTQTRLHRLADVYNQFPFVVLVKKGIVLEHLGTLGKISTIVTDESYNVIKSSFVGKRKVELQRKCEVCMGSGQNAFALHSNWVEDKLYKVIPDCIRTPPQGRRYIRLADDTWANLWIDVKSILSDPSTALFVAYQLGYLLSKGYTQIPEEEVFVASNNNAYVIASFLQQIFHQKELIMLDRLGPYPSLSRTRLLEAQGVEGKICCVVEDVLGTGREIDLTTLLVFLAKGRVQRVACMYDLQIASPLLVRDQEVISLCKPSPRVRYQRQPKYKGYMG